MKHLWLIQPNALVRNVYPKATWHGSRSAKTIYLTFDDGPIYGLTEWVLAELNKYNAKATFFCVGDNILRNPDLFKQIGAEGHLAANHTMHHTKGLKCSIGEYLEEADECRKLVGNDLFRPPYGQLRRGQYKGLMRKGYRIILWDVISYDYEQISPEKCAANVLDHTRNGSIILFHDNIKAEKNIRHALPIVLEHFSSLGYAFKALESREL